MTVGIGEAGARVARQVYERTGWFPVVRRVDITHVEDGRVGYFFSGTDGRLWPERARRPRAGSRPRYRYALCLHWERIFEQLGLEEVRLEAPRPWAQGLALLGVRRPAPSTDRRLPSLSTLR